MVIALHVLVATLYMVIAACFGCYAVYGGCFGRFGCYAVYGDCCVFWLLRCIW